MNSKIPDKSLTHILNKILKPVNPSLDAISQRYQLWPQQQSQQNSRIVNYTLQDRNLELRKQFKKLEAMLNGKMKVKERLDNTEAEIQELRGKLRAVLNVSQGLEGSLVKMKERGQGSKVSRRTVEEWQCCCSKRRKEKQHSISIVKKSQNLTINQPQPSNPSTFEYLTVGSKPKPPTKTQQTQTEWPYLQAEHQRLQQKRNHIEKLKNIILEQNRMIEQYESSIRSQGKVGKFAKSSELKLNAYVRTCASVGSIVKASQLPK